VPIPAAFCYLSFFIRIQFGTRAKGITEANFKVLGKNIFLILSGRFGIYRFF
jgi:hypothetical protein